LKVGKQEKQEKLILEGLAPSRPVGVASSLCEDKVALGLALNRRQFESGQARQARQVNSGGSRSVETGWCNVRTARINSRQI